MSAARLVEHDAGHLLDPLLMSSLLKLECSMPRDVKRAGLALFFTVSICWECDGLAGPLGSPL